MPRGELILYILCMFGDIDDQYHYIITWSNLKDNKNISFNFNFEIYTIHRNFTNVLNIHNASVLN